MNNKSIAIITSSAPNAFGGGGVLTVHSIAAAFLKAHYSVTIITYREEALQKQAKLSDNPDIGIFFIKKPNLLPVRFLNFFLTKSKVQSLLKQIKPDAVFSYHWEGLAATFGIRGFRKVGIVGDPMHLPLVYRSSFKKEFTRGNCVIENIKYYFLRLTLPFQNVLMRRLLLDCNVAGAFAHHHAKMLRNYGVSSCRYFRTPLPDPFESEVRQRRLEDKPKILLLGHLKGIATLSGISLFAQEIFPALKTHLGRDSFEVHIVGNFFETLPDRLKTMLDDPAIKIRGHINPIDNEFLSSHLLLVPTPIELGIRVRILTAFSFATPVVAHLANKSGIPELEHEKNVLLSDSGNGLAEEVVRLLRDQNLQGTLGGNARKTYEDYFSLESAGRQIVNATQDLA